MHRPRGAVWFFQHLIIALSQRVAAGSTELRLFFPQASRLITAHFAWIAPYRPRACENASGSYYTTPLTKNKSGDYKLQ